MTTEFITAATEDSMDAAEPLTAAAPLTPLQRDMAANNLLREELIGTLYEREAFLLALIDDPDLVLALRRVNERVTTIMTILHNARQQPY